MILKLVPTLAISLLIFGTGCSSRPHTGHVSQSSVRLSHERQMNSQWVGRTYEELIQEKGHAGMQMNIPGNNSIANFVVVYETDSGSGCLETFAISRGEAAIIRDYFCR